MINRTRTAAIPARIKLAIGLLTAALALTTVFTSSASATQPTSQNDASNLLTTTQSYSSDELQLDPPARKSAEVNRTAARAAMNTDGPSANVSGKPVPSLAPRSMSAFPYNGMISATLTHNGKPIPGVHTIDAQMFIDGFWFGGEFTVTNGEVDMLFLLEPGDIGKSVQFVMSIPETANFAAASSSTRTYQVIDLPSPTITTPPTSRYYSPVGGLDVGVSLPKNIHFPVDFLDVTAVAHFADGMQTVDAPVIDGIASFVYTTSPPTFRVTFSAAAFIDIDGDQFTKAASLPPRNYPISQGVQLSITPPRSTTLARRGTSTVQLQGAGITQANGQIVTMYVDVAGRSFAFNGRINRGSATISYSLPESMLDKRASVRYQIDNGPVLLATSSSARNYTIVK